MQPGLKRLILGVLLFIFGVIAFPIFVIIPLAKIGMAEQAFLAPSSTTVEAKEAGNYYLWNKHHTTYNDQDYVSSIDLPDDLTISIQTANGEELEFINNTSHSTSNGTEAKQSIGHFEVFEPGALTITTEGNIEERVFSFSKIDFEDILKTIIGAGIASLIIIITGLVLGIWGIVKLSKKSTPNNQPPSYPASPPPLAPQQ